MEPAPFHADLAAGPGGGPVNGHAVWLTTPDDVRIRAGFWPGGTKGTVFLLCGRTEFIEKYGPTARDLAQAGYAAASIDWRGQGLADRLAADPMLGHVEKFSDYQMDLAAMITAARSTGMPEPYILLGHSMGGAIGYRALLSDHPFQGAIFSGPMWGIAINPVLAPLARSIAQFLIALGRSTAFAPSTRRVSYVATGDFAGNTLTHDHEIWKWMQSQARGVEGFALGGPSVRWLFEALTETRAFRAEPPAKVPALVAWGGEETIIDVAAVSRLAQRLPQADIKVIEGARHELLMEAPRQRQEFLEAIVSLLDRITT
ncbi:MAG: alpha/beta hydrolase [Pseudomonadota bacterium]